jgi:hypothetical protein
MLRYVVWGHKLHHLDTWFMAKKCTCPTCNRHVPDEEEREEEDHTASYEEENK